MPLVMVEVSVAALSALGIGVVYAIYHRWWDNPFTRWFASQIAGYGLILLYVGYNVLARWLGWPVASRTIVAVIVYGIIAVIELSGMIVLTYLTVRQRRTRSPTATPE